MIRHRPRERLLAVCLAALAGFVDALGFIHLGGVFISFMSGNSTRLSVGVVDRLDQAFLPAVVIVLFVLGVVSGSLVRRAVKRGEAAVLLQVSVLLAAAAAFDTIGIAWAAIGFAAFAMGCENAVFERDGEVSIGVTYMTGTLVKLGQRITSALLGGPRWAWLWYLSLWLALVGGAVAGAALYPVVGLQALWPAAAAAAILAVLAHRGL